MSEFIRPQVQVEEINETSARVSVEPLERGYGDKIFCYSVGDSVFGAGNIFAFCL